MRKLFLFVLALALAGGAVFGQEIDVQSIQSRSSGGLIVEDLFDNIGDAADNDNVRLRTQGLFGSEFDAITSVVETARRPSFSQLDQRYLFAGLGGWLHGNNVNSGLNSLDPFIVGLYLPDPRMSFLHSVAADGFENIDTRETTTATQAKTVDDVTYNYLTSRTETNRKAPLFSELDIEHLFITELGDFNAGVHLSVTRTNTDFDPDSNFSSEEILYYDSEQNDPDAEPDSESYWTITQEETNLEEDATGTASEDIAVTSVTLGTPFFSREAGFFVSPSIGWTRNNNSNSELVDNDFDGYDGLGAGSFTDIDNETTDIESIYDLLVSGGQIMPGIWGDHDRNELRIDGSLGMQLRTRRFSQSEESQVFDYQDDVIVTEQDAVTESTDRDYDTGLNYSLGLGASHSFYYDVGSDFEFGFAPEAGLQVTLEGAEPRQTRQVFVDTNDEETVTETEYEHRDRDIKVSTSLATPISLSGRPDDWIFGFTMGATPVVAYGVEYEIAYTEPRSRNVQTDDAGDVVFDNRFEDDERTVTRTNEWVFDTAYQLGLNVPLSEQAKLDIVLGGAGLLGFNTMSIEATVAF